MAYKYVKAVCLFCDATVEGAEEFMLGGKRFDHKGGRPERWLKEKPEHKWAWNGITSRCEDGRERQADFYLCPEHQSDDDYDKAFSWAEEHSKRMPLIKS